MRVECVDSLARFESLRDAWRDLVADSAMPNPFLTWEWLITWWRRLAGEGRLTLLAGWSGGRLDLLAPFMARGREIARGKPWPRLDALGTGSVGSDYLDIVVRRGAEREALDVLARWLQGTAMSVTLPRVDHDAARVHQVAERLAGWGWRVALVPADVSPYATLASHTWESYLGSLGREHRSNVRRRLRALHARYAVRLERVETDEDRLTALATLFRLHELRWRARGGSTAFHTPALLAFHRDFTRLALSEGWLRLYVLRLDGRPAAALYGLRFAETFYFYQSGFDPDFAADGVGLAMMAMAIREAIAEGVAEYDFLHGAEPYKFLWTRQVRALSHLALYPPTAPGRLSMHVADAVRVARAAVRRVAPTGAA